MINTCAVFHKYQRIFLFVCCCVVLSIPFWQYIIDIYRENPVAGKTCKGGICGNDDAKLPLLWTGKGQKIHKRTHVHSKIMLMNIHEKLINTTRDNGSGNISFITSSPVKGIKLKDNDVFNHKMAVLIPFRDRQEELQLFIPYMFRYLHTKKIQHTFYILHQIDKYRFNKASLINVGFLESSKDCDYIAIHDVDLLPQNPHLDYGYPEKGPYHVSPSGLHPRYNYPGFLGGILLMTREQFQKVNGMSNNFWGWGKEDDELAMRMDVTGLKVQRPSNLTTGYRDTFKHLHDDVKRKRDDTRFHHQKTIHVDMKSGLSDVQYTIGSRKDVLIGGTKATFINVRLKCDLAVTTWCLTDEDQFKYRIFDSLENKSVRKHQKHLLKHRHIFQG